MEVTVKIQAPELTEAINALAAAIAGSMELLIDGQVKTPPPAAEDTVTPTTTEPEEVKTIKEPAKVVKLEDVRAKLADLMQGGKGDKVKELFQKFGVTKLTALPEDKLPELMQEAEAI